MCTLNVNADRPKKSHWPFIQVCTLVPLLQLQRSGLKKYTAAVPTGLLQNSYWSFYEITIIILLFIISKKIIILSVFKRIKLKYSYAL